MAPTWTSCSNCGAALECNTSSCDRCGADQERPKTGRPRFSEETRQAAEGLGGLLKLYIVEGVRVQYVGWCPAGAIGIDASGKVVWEVDWGYMASVSVERKELRFDDKLADIETGRLL